jgi:endonuclease III
MNVGARRSKLPAPMAVNQKPPTKPPRAGKPAAPPARKAAPKAQRAAAGKSTHASRVAKGAKATKASKVAKTTKAAKKPVRVAPAADEPAQRKPAAKARAKRLPAAPASELRAILGRAIPDPRCELRFDSPFGLLIATILAAQSTDRAVNEVMKTLLARWPDAAALAQAGQEEVEDVVRRTGFFHNKARAIRETAALLVRDHRGLVPRTMDELVRLKGVARKTANVVLGTAYGESHGFVVDTHVARVSNRLGLTREEDPVKIERDLCALFPREDWPSQGHRLTLHGRYTCTAKKPDCERCPLNELCPSRLVLAQGTATEREQLEAIRVHAELVKTGVLA